MKRTKRTKRGRGGGKGKSKQHHKQEQQHPQDTPAGRRIQVINIVHILTSVFSFLHWLYNDRQS